MPNIFAVRSLDAGRVFPASQNSYRHCEGVPCYAPESRRPLPNGSSYSCSGRPGSAKTTAAIQFPNSYIIDSERGAENYDKLITESGSVVFQTTDIHDVIQEVKGLLTERHDFRTLVIDPITLGGHAQRHDPEMHRVREEPAAEQQCCRSVTMKSRFLFSGPACGARRWARFGACVSALADAPRKRGR